MSGVAGGIALLPLLLGGLEAVVIVKAADAAIKEVSYSSDRFDSEYRRDRKRLRKSAAIRELSEVRSQVAADMNEQLRLNVEVSNRMMSEIEKNRTELMNILNSGEEERYREYIEQLSDVSAELINNIYGMQEDFVKNYHIKINESMNSITNTINRQYSAYLKELEQYHTDRNAKKELARNIAEDYIKEAEALMISLEEDYGGAKLSGDSLNELKEALNAAKSQYNIENYEAAIAAAKDVSINVIEEIYHADCKAQEWDNYYKCAVSLAIELETYMEAQETITEDMKQEAENRTGKQLEDDIVGIKLSEYTDIMKNGMHRYDYLLKKTREIKVFLESDDAKSADVIQLKEYIDLLSKELYPAATKAVYKGILNMNNAFSRQNISEEIIDFFEDHNFNFDGYSYDDDRHDGALHIGLSNDTTGEEIIVTLAPELMQSGDVQTRVEINQLKGDETNEERKEYYRTSVQNVVLENTPGAQIHLECDQSTRNQLSQKTELRDKIKL